MIEKKYGKRFIVITLTIFACCLFLSAGLKVSFAETGSSGFTAGTDDRRVLLQEVKLGGRWEGYADLPEEIDPLGIKLVGGIDYRNSYRYNKEYDAVSGYWQAGSSLGITPAYAQPSIEFEWMPWLPMIFNMQFDGYYFFGANGGLLSFSSAKQPFGDAERRARKGLKNQASAAGSCSSLRFSSKLIRLLFATSLTLPGQVPGKGTLFFRVGI